MLKKPLEISFVFNRVIQVLDLSDITEGSTKITTVQAESAQIQKKETKSISRKRSRYSIGYRLSTGTAPSDLALGSFLDNRISLHSEDESLYLFISRSAGASIDNGLYYLSNGIDVYFESEFSRVQFGCGYVFPRFEYETNLTGHVEFMFSRYLGEDDEFDLQGVSFKLGAEYKLYETKHWLWTPNVTVGYSTLYTAIIDGAAYSMSPSLSGFVYDVGMTVKYLFK